MYNSTTRFYKLILFKLQVVRCLMTSSYLTSPGMERTFIVSATREKSPEGSKAYTPPAPPQVTRVYLQLKAPCGSIAAKIVHSAWIFFAVMKFDDLICQTSAKPLHGAMSIV